ncbi:bicaudal-D-related protein 2-like [Genypterus blacodes]|uniref:bicaudal-D-related protein 2-like n=1 Tax=Genypterus blacodes TaxID=154954 RepID=UPI003F7588F9
MNFTEPFSALNEKLKPQGSVCDQLHSSLTRLEDRQLGSSTRSSTLPRPTFARTTVPLSAFLSREPERDCVSTTDSRDPEESEHHAEQEGLTHAGLDEGDDFDPMMMCVIPVLNLEDVGQEELVGDEDEEDKSDETDGPQNLTLEESEEASERADMTSEGVSTFRRKYNDRTLPDLIRSGRPLGRRRTLGNVSDTLKEVRKEVELSRQRSIKLKAQVDKLQENREGPGWSQHRERVTEEVLSVLRLLNPLTESNPTEPPQDHTCLDTALSQLQLVARKLAMNHTKKGRTSGSEQSAILQQALRDRDEAIQKKKAMEEELLRSKTEMMLLNNQVIEAVQKRLELTLELDAWKEDIQLIIRQQVQMQMHYQAEQAQKKITFLDRLRGSNKPPTPIPVAEISTTSTQHHNNASHTTNNNQIFMPRPNSSPVSTLKQQANTSRTWRDKLRRAKPRDLDSVVQDWKQREDDGFQSVSLD